jgi:hypothetical protein
MTRIEKTKTKNEKNNEATDSRVSSCDRYPKWDFKATKTSPSKDPLISVTTSQPKSELGTDETTNTETD